MTREQYDKLQQYEQELRYAVRMNFMSLSNGKFGEIMTIYKEMYGEMLNKSQMGCSTCRLNALKRIGNDYFGFQQELAKKEKEERLSETTTKKKAGRPKKIDLDAEQ